MGSSYAETARVVWRGTGMRVYLTLGTTQSASRSTRPAPASADDPGEPPGSKSRAPAASSTGEHGSMAPGHQRGCCRADPPRRISTHTRARPAHSEDAGRLDNIPAGGVAGAISRLLGVRHHLPPAGQRAIHLVGEVGSNAGGSKPSLRSRGEGPE